MHVISKRFISFAPRLTDDFFDTINKGVFAHSTRVDEPADLLFAPLGNPVMSHATSAQLISESLAQASCRSPDFTQTVYDRLFLLRPETRTLFRQDPKNLIKGSMLELAIDAILDFIGPRKAAHRLIICEVQSHDGYGTTPELFIVFFVAIAEVVREVLIADWTPAHQKAWDDLIRDLNDYVARGVTAMA